MVNEHILLIEHMQLKTKYRDGRGSFRLSKQKRQQASRVQILDQIAQWVEQCHPAVIEENILFAIDKRDEMRLVLLHCQQDGGYMWLTQSIKYQPPVDNRGYRISATCSYPPLTYFSFDEVAWNVALLANQWGAMFPHISEMP
jgi:hypothetical protein